MRNENRFKWSLPAKVTRLKLLPVVTLLILMITISNLLSTSTDTLARSTPDEETLPPIFTENGIDGSALRQIEMIHTFKPLFVQRLFRFLSTEYDDSESLELPKYTSNFANVWEERLVTDQPVFWLGMSIII